MRIAFVDLIFSWPPNGGADVDLFHVAAGLQRTGHEVRLFVVHEHGSTERGRVEPGRLPFPCEILNCGPRDLRPERLCPRLRRAVDAWRPDAVFLSHGFALKPYVCAALAHHRTVGRYYAHELTCARDVHRFRAGAPCPNDYLRRPDTCRACALDGQRDAIRAWNFRTWTADYLAARAYAPGYHHTLLDSLRTLDAVVVSNQTLRRDLDGFHDNVVVIPGGVDLGAFDAARATAAEHEKGHKGRKGPKGQAQGLEAAFADVEPSLSPSSPPLKGDEGGEGTEESASRLLHGPPLKGDEGGEGTEESTSRLLHGPPLKGDEGGCSSSPASCSALSEARTVRPRKVILMTGRADDPLKGLDTLLRAGEQLRATRTDFEVRITHPDEALTNDWLVSTGWLDHAAALRLYDDADIVAVPSLWEEPFGLVAVEAMAAGLPVCASRRGGLCDIVRDGETGFLFPAGDAAALADALGRLLDDAPLRAGFGAAGRRVVEAEYTWDAIIARHYAPLLERLCHG